MSRGRFGCGADLSDYLKSSIVAGLASMTSQNGGQDGRHGPKMAAMTSRSRWV